MKKWHFLVGHLLVSPLNTKMFVMKIDILYFLYDRFQKFDNYSRGTMSEEKGSTEGILLEDKTRNVQRCSRAASQSA